jgi:hypothetical protein
VDGQGEAADLGVADGLFAAGVAGEATAAQAGEGGVGECCAGELTVAVVVGVAQQCAEPVDLCGAGHRQLVAGASSCARQRR